MTEVIHRVTDKGGRSMTETAASQPSEGFRTSHGAAAWPFVRQSGWLAITAGLLFLVPQIVMWTFDQRMNLESSQDPLFIMAKIILLVGFIVLMFALISVHGLQAQKVSRLGAAAFSVAIVGTMMLAGDLWFEAFAVPWLAAGPAPESVTAQPSLVFALGALSSYFLFAAGWTLFGIASVWARVFRSPSPSPSSSEESSDTRRCWRHGEFRLA